MKVLSRIDTKYLFWNKIQEITKLFVVKVWSYTVETRGEQHGVVMRLSSVFGRKHTEYGICNK